MDISATKEDDHLDDDEEEPEEEFLNNGTLDDVKNNAGICNIFRFRPRDIESL